MSADLITVAYTTLSGIDPDDGAAEAAIISHLEAIRKDIDQIGYMEYFEGIGYDENIREEDGTDGLLPTLWEGWQAHKQGHLSNQYTIPAEPGGKPLWFNIVGGSSWDDSPFEGYDALCMLINAIDRFPSLGEKLGILGGGIVIPGRTTY